MATVLPYRLRHKMPAHFIAAFCFVISMIIFSGHARAVCSGPAGVEGEVIYNSAHNVPQYCDDTNWIAMTGGQPQSDVGPTSGLMGYWTLDEASGTFVDLSGNGNNGSAVGTVDYAQTGVIGNAAGFVGGGAEYVDVPYDASLTPTEDMTIAFWVRPDQDWDSIGGTVWRLMDTHAGGSDSNPGWYFIANGYLGGQMYLTAGDGSGSTSWGSSFSDWDVGTWYHIAVVFEQNGTTPSVTYYRNGTATNTATGTVFTPDWGTDALRIGAGYYNDSLDGLMDDVRYYDRALSAAEIAELYNLKIPTKIAPNGLIAHWRLDETSGSSAADSSGNDNDGSVVSGTITSGPAVINNGISDVNFRKINPNGLSATEVTVSSWVKVTTDFDFNDVISFNWGSGTGGYALYSNASGNIDFGVMNGGVQRRATDFNAVKIGEWMHWVGTYDGTDIKLYLNGVLVDTESGYPGITLQTSGDFWFVDLGEYMMVDDIRVYNRAISAEEVRDLYFARDGIRYNRDTRSPQFFDGNKWVAMEPDWFEVPSGLVGHWKLDEQTGTTVADSTGNGHVGSWTGSASVNSVPGAVSTAYHFDGVNDGVIISDSANLEVQTDFSASVWVKLDVAGGGDQKVLFKEHSVEPYVAWELKIGTSDEITFQLSNTASNSGTGTTYFYVGTTPLSPGQWYHVAAVKDDGDISIYLNGTEEEWFVNEPYTGTPIDSDGPLSMGSRQGANALLRGQIDDARFYSRALTASEIMKLYQMGAPVGTSTALPQSCPNIGDVCDDGTIYAGLAPEDGTTPMFAVSFDSPTTLPWNNNNTSGHVLTNITDNVTGEANTNALVILDSDSVTAGFQPHQAAEYCYNLTASGADDWYLPTWNEIDVMLNNHIAFGITPDRDYWISDENSTTNARRKWYESATQTIGTGNNPKEADFYARCVRKGPAPRCANPYGKEGAMIYNNDANVLQYCDGARWVAIGKMN